MTPRSTLSPLKLDTAPALCFTDGVKTWKGIPSLRRATAVYARKFGASAVGDAISDLEHIYDEEPVRISRSARDAITANTLLRVANLSPDRYTAHGNLELVGETLNESREVGCLVLRDSNGKVAFKGC